MSEARQAARRRCYGFDRVELRPVVAHDGRGEVLTRRVEDRRTPGGAHFLDLTVVPPGCTVGVHVHGPADEEYYVIVSGRGRMRLEGEEFEIGPGDVIVNNRSGTHGLANDGPEDLRMVVIETPARALEPGEDP